MRSNRVRVAVAASFALSLTLAACGGGTSGDSGNSEGEGGGDNTLTAWAWDPAFNVLALEEAEKVFQEENPDFTLEIQDVLWDEVQVKLGTIAQSQEYGELPDIVLIQNNAFQKNVLNYPELFADLSDSGIDFAEFPEGVTAYSTIDGVHYGVPFDSGTAVTALRTDILEEAGYTVDDFTDITWEEFIANGEDILAKTGKPLLSGTAGTADTIMMMLQSTGASLFDDEGNPSIVGNDALNAAIATYQELVDKGVFQEVNSWDEYTGSLVNGEVAGTINGIWISGSLQQAADQSGNWAVTNVPRLEGVDGATQYSANGGSSWALTSNADTELAAEFLAATFAGSTELYDTILPSAGALGNWLPAGESDAYEEPQEFYGGQTVYADVLEFSSEVPSNNTGVYYYEARDNVSAAITQIINGADPEEALQNAQAAVEFAMN